MGYNLRLLDINRERIAVIDKHDSWRYTQRPSEATEISVTLPREALEAVLPEGVNANTLFSPNKGKHEKAQVAHFIEIYKGSQHVITGRISRREISDDVVNIKCHSEEILLETQVTPAQYGRKWDNWDLADVARDLLHGWYTLRVKDHSQWGQCIEAEGVDLDTEPGVVMLAKSGGHYVSQGHITLRFNRDDVPGFVAWDRIRWASDNGSPVRTTMQYRSNGGSWSQEFEGALPDEIGVVPGVVDANTIDVRINLYTKDQVTQGPDGTPIGQTPYVFSVELIARTKGVLEEGTIPASAGVFVSGLDADGASAFNVLSQACQQTGWEFWVKDGRLNIAREMGQDRTNSVLLREGTNMTVTTLSDGDDELVNVLTAYGPGEGINRLMIVREHEASRQKFGPYPGQQEFPEATTLEALKAAADDYLEEHGWPKPDFRVEAYYPHDKEPEFGVGDYVRVADPKKGIITRTRIAEITRSSSTQGYRVTLYLGSPPPNLARQVRPVPPPREVRPPEKPEISVSMIPGGIRVTDTRTPTVRWLTTECHVSAEPGFTPSAETLVQNARQAKFDVTGLTAGVRYYARLVRIDPNGNEAVSDERSAVAGDYDEEPDLTPPEAPTGLAAIPVVRGHVLTWDRLEAPPLLDRYEIQRSSRKSGASWTDWALVSDEVRSSFYPDEGLDLELEYRYRIRAVSRAGVAGDWSAELVAGEPGRLSLAEEVVDRLLREHIDQGLLDEIEDLEAGLDDASKRLEDAENRLVGAEERLDSVEDQLDEAQSRLDGAEDRLGGAEDRLEAAEQDLEGIEDRVTENEATLTKHAQEIAARVTQTVFDALESRVSNAESELSVQADQIAAKVEQSVFDVLAGTVADHTAQLSLHANEIAARVTKTVFDALEGRVTNAESELSVHADQIAAKVEQSVFDVLAGTVADHTAQLSVHANEIQSRVTQTEFDALKEDVSSRPKVKPEGGHLFHFDSTLESTQGLEPLPNAVATLRPGEGRFGGAVAVEEGTTNHCTADGEDGDVVWRRDTDGVTFSLSSEVALFGRYSTKWSKDPKSGTGNAYINNRFSSFSSDVWTFSCYVKRADNKPVTSVGRVYIYVGDSKTNFPASIVPVGNGWYRVIATRHVSTPGRVSLVGFSALDGTTDWFFDGWQVEAKPYATSYVNGTRGNGRLEYPQEVWSLEQGTFSCWAKMPVDTTEERALILQWGEGDTGASTRFGVTMLPNGRLSVHYGSSNTFRTRDRYDDGEWRHVVLTWVNGTSDVHLYIDGQRVASAGEPVSVSNPGGRYGGVIPIGHRGYSYNNQWWNSLIDELLFLPYAASEEEIKSWYESKAPFYDPDGTAYTTSRILKHESTLTQHADQIAARVTQSTFDTLAGRVTDAESKLAVHAQEIAARVTQTVFDTLAGRVSNAESQLTVHANQIAAKVEQSVFNTLAGTVSEHAATLATHANQIAARVTKTVFDALERRVSNAESELSVHADEIQARVTKTIFDALKEEVSHRPNTKPRDGHLFHFDSTLQSTQGLQPLPGAVATLRPGEGRFGGAVAVESATTNLVVLHNNFANIPIGGENIVSNRRIERLDEFTFRVTYLADISGTGNLSISNSFVWPYPAVLSANILEYYVAPGSVGYMGLGRSSSGGPHLHANDGVLGRKVFKNTGQHSSSYALSLRASGSSSLIKAGSFITFSMPQVEAGTWDSSFVYGSRPAGRLSYPKSLVAGRDALTFAVWTTGPELAAPSNKYLIACQTTGSSPYGDHLMFRQGGSTNHLSISVRNEANNRSATVTHNGLWNGEWRFVVLVLDRNPAGGRRPIELYIDGELVGSSSTVDAVPDFANIDETYGVQVGNWRGSLQWRGLIDELLILPYAASPEEIKSWYETQAPFYDPDETAYTAAQIEKHESTLTQHANAITAAVSRIDNNDADIAALTVKSNQISSSVSRLEGDMVAAQSAISQQADQIALRVQAVDENNKPIQSAKIVIAQQDGEGYILLDAKRVLAGTLELTENLSIANQDGSIKFKSTGIEIGNEQGITRWSPGGLVFISPDNVRSGYIRGMLAGIATDGEYVNLPFTNHPQVFLQPYDMMVFDPTYSNQKQRLQLEPVDVSPKGFRVVARTVIESGSDLNHTPNKTTYTLPYFAACTGSSGHSNSNPGKFSEHMVRDVDSYRRYTTTYTNATRVSVVIQEMMHVHAYAGNYTATNRLTYIVRLRRAGQSTWLETHGPIQLSRTVSSSLFTTATSGTHSKRTIVFDNLQPGQYEFEVRVTDKFINTAGGYNRNEHCFVLIDTWTESRVTPIVPTTPPKVQWLAVESDSVVEDSD